MSYICHASNTTHCLLLNWRPTQSSWWGGDKETSVSCVLIPTVTTTPDVSGPGIGGREGVTLDLAALGRQVCPKDPALLRFSVIKNCSVAKTF